MSGIKTRFLLNQKSGSICVTAERLFEWLTFDKPQVCDGQHVYWMNLHFTVVGKYNSHAFFTVLHKLSYSLGVHFLYIRPLEVYGTVNGCMGPHRLKWGRARIVRL
jgi:hypothetical protein